MPDRDKVIKAIELEIKHENTWECRKECPYYGKTDCNCFTQVLVDALKLLKEQKPVKPIVEQYALPLTNTSVRFIKKHYCGICKEEITGNNVFCHKCGRKVKWDDSDRNGNG